MDVYRQQTGDMDAQPEVGGHVWPADEAWCGLRGLVPGTADTMHQADEFQPKADLPKAMAIYGQPFELLISRRSGEGREMAAE